MHKRLESSETLCRTPKMAKIKSDLHSDVERLAEMTSPPSKEGREATDVSVIPCRLIGGLHEGINEPSTVLGCHSVNPLAGEHAGDPRRETKTPWTFTAACRCDTVAGAERRREPSKPGLRIRWRRQCNTALLRLCF